MEIGQKLKEKRAENQLTQEALSEKIFVSKKTISNWETGKTTPDIDSLIRLASLFDLSLDNLLLEGSEVVEKISNESKYKKIYKRLFVALLILIISFVSYSFFWLNYKDEQWQKIVRQNDFLEDAYDLKAYEDKYEISVQKPNFPYLIPITNDITVRLITDNNSVSTIELNKDKSKSILTTLDSEVSFVKLTEQLNVDAKRNKHLSEKEIKLAEKELENISDEQIDLINFTIKKWNKLNPEYKLDKEMNKD